MAFDSRQTGALPLMLAGVTIIGLVGALGLGRVVAQNDYRMLGFGAAAAAGMVLALGMGKNIWLLIPLLWPLTGKIAMLPLPFSVREIGVLAAFGMYLAFTAFKKVPRSAPLNRCDIFLFINLAYILTVFARNPAGIRALGSDMVGGRPYFEILVAFFAYWVLQHITIDVKMAYKFPLLMAGANILVSGLGVLTARVPALVPFIAPFYSGINVTSYLDEVAGRQSTDFRLTNLSGFGTTWSTLLASYYSPTSLYIFARPLQSLIFLAAIVAILLSGYRNMIFSFVMFTLIVSYFRNGFPEVVRLGTIYFMGVLLIIGAQASGISVHPAAQRALSFIPGPWDEEVIKDASGSTEWRVEMWQIAFESDRYIKNKILGDGFGFSAAELAIQLSASFGGQGYIGGNRAENQLVTGSYHSGPLSSIRYAGIVGLVLYLALQFAMSVYAYRIIKECLRTPWQPLAFYVGVVTLIGPLIFIFIFGGYDGFGETIFTLAILNLCHRSFKVWKAEQIKTSAQSPLLPAVKKDMPVPA